MNRRENWVDAIRGFAIICMVLGHITRLFIPEWGNIFSFICFLIWSFHMPLFFLIGGYVYKPVQRDRLASALLEKTIDLLVPAIVFEIGLFVIESTKISEGGVLNCFVDTINTDWFLLVFWFVSIVMLLITSMGISLKIFFLVCFSLIFLIYPISAFFSRLFLYLAAYTGGILLKNKQITICKKRAVISGILYIPLSIAIYYITKQPEIPNPVYKAVLSVLACYVLVYWFKECELSSRVLVLCGKKSLEIYIFHIWSLFLLRNNENLLDKLSMVPNEIMAVFVTVINIVLILLFVRIFENCKFMRFLKKASLFLIRKD